MTVGGGMKDGETLEQTARREAFEETSLSDLSLGPLLWLEKKTLICQGQPILFNQSWILARTNQTKVSRDHLELDEQVFILDHKWWTFHEIQTTQERITHHHLTTLLPPVLSGVYPDPPLGIGE